MGNKQIERHYWCNGCLAYRPAYSRKGRHIFCADGHKLDQGWWADFIIARAGGSERRV